MSTDDTTAAKDPQDWATGDEPATAAQLSYLTTLSNDTGREVPQDLTKAQASELIDELRGASPRIADGTDGTDDADDADGADGADGVN